MRLLAKASVSMPGLSKGLQEVRQRALLYLGEEHSWWWEQYRQRPCGGSVSGTQPVRAEPWENSRAELEIEGRRAGEASRPWKGLWLLL